MLDSDRGYSSSLGPDMEDLGADMGADTGADMGADLGVMGLERGLSEDDSNTGYALVINGHSLVHALQPKLEKLFLDIGTQCASQTDPVESSESNRFELLCR